MVSDSRVIHPTAIVHPTAELGEGVIIGPYCVIGADVKLGDRVNLHSHVIIDGPTEVGFENEFFPFCVLGGPPQDLGYKKEKTTLKIGNKNSFREGTSIHRGTPKDRGETTIGNNNFIMGYCHIAHDCELGDHIIMANQTALAGHVKIGNFANIGGQTGITQWVRVGEYSFIGAGTVMRRDLPPYMCAKEFSQVSGPNLVGLKRGGVPEEDVRMAREIFKTLYLGNATTEKAILEIESLYGHSGFVQKFIKFVRETKIGIQR